MAPNLVAFCLLVTTTLLAPPPAASFGIDDAVDTVDFVKEVVHDILNIWDVVGTKIVPDDTILPPFLKKKNQKILDRMVQVARSVDKAQDMLMSSSVEAIGNLKYDLANLIQYNSAFHELIDKINKIDAAHRDFTDYINRTDKYERHTTESFAVYVVSHNPDSVQKLTEQLHQLIVPETGPYSFNDKSILLQLREGIEEVDANICNIQQSPQQILYNIYVSLQMTQLKGYTMMQFSWMLLRLYNRGNFTLEAETSRNKYVQQMKQQVQIAKETIADASTAMWRCDARKQVEDETYTKLTRLLQGYIVNEVNLNRQKSCGESCGYYSHTEQYSCYEGGFCHQQLKCEGKITDCTFVDSDMEICSTEIRSHRRYNWIKYKNGKQMGQDQTCTNVRKVDSWWRYLLWHCSYCFCLCDDARFSDRYFNLRPAISDTGLNRVVTALRFTKYNHVIHLQIQEGELLPKGLINETSVHWVPLDDYSVGKADSRPGVDYHMMSWDERALDLDDIVAPTGYVMTGVKFRKLGTHLNLEVRITPFNFTTGHLIKPHKKSEWISNDNTDGSEKPRQLLTSLASKDLDIPTRGPSENKPDSRNDTFLLFTHSSIDADVAQHTVPFFDTQQVAPNPVTPLAGAGLMHKGLPKFGGYVAPKVFTYNMADHLQSDFGDLDKNSSV
ncbi:uncharacterized protein LOC111046010 isoform X1 [Nilaparvata lugens]|uniref:uncharacterized protein LOC111046010 isoform X1 n=1 Tax=Nilaparvata lugens TaxID=108931 RepID=UPI00193E25E6|nr:uncharacterized protein LOC111046010 isoform X1 [Nilaparvata lugens]XP_039296532.1 uncharacterized protein LOC111046010 isoform X1 [Nilaparvata lugens]XP_039296533.1 uncharacterized protein LOC111046010 isoform X1 [Nilaparvata lugens]